ncbi:MAG TPA: hypothetical protein VHC86_09340 [Opitutaceae bacterium]|nr:hypothetical protein [Opitutaceae bacterium]
MLPPFLPAEALRRVVRISRFDGLMVLTVAGAFAVASALTHDRTGTLVGLLVAGTGAVELHGAALLRHGFARGMRWLIGSQALLMAAVLGFAAWSLYHVDAETLNWMTAAAVAGPNQAKLAQMGISDADAGYLFYKTCFVSLAVATVLYQGGMIVYYLRRGSAVRTALSSEE